MCPGTFAGTLAIAAAPAPHFVRAVQSALDRTSCQPRFMLAIKTTYVARLGTGTWQLSGDIVAVSPGMIRPCRSLTTPHGSGSWDCDWEVSSGVWRAQLRIGQNAKSEKSEAGDSVTDSCEWR